MERESTGKQTIIMTRGAEIDIPQQEREVDANSRQRHYWASRPDRNNLDYFWTELQKGRLRQGWGYRDDQNLNLILAEKQKGGDWWARLSEEQRDAYRNYPFHPGWGDDTMQKGDIVLIPNMPTFGSFSLGCFVDDEYQYDISDEGDYGHWRQIALLTPDGIVSDHESVHADIRSTLRCRSRIWRIDGVGLYLETLLKLLQADNMKAGVHFSPDQRFSKIVLKAKEAAREPAREAARKEIEALLDAEFHARDFEFAVQLVLRKLFLGSIEHLGGKSEEKHGTDLLVKIDNPFGEIPFIIPVQVKKHTGESEYGIEQLEMAAEYWKKEGHSEGILIALALITTADSVTLARARLDALESKSGLPCYLLGRKQVIELFVDAAGDRVW